MKTKPILIASIALNIAALVFATAYVQHRGGLAWLASRLSVSGQTSEIPKIPLPAVDNRILMIGDSHLAIHPWEEYSRLSFSNRAVSGSRIRDIRLDAIGGNPALVVVSTSTNDLQDGITSSGLAEIKISLEELFSKIASRWPRSAIIYVSPPHPNVAIYEKYIRARYPGINRPMPEHIDSIRNFVASLGIVTLQAKSANIDGLHIDPESAIGIAKELEKYLQTGRSIEPADTHR